MEKIHRNMHVCMYFLHLVLTFTPHYIIMVNGLLSKPIAFVVFPCPDFFRSDKNLGAGFMICKEGSRTMPN